MSNILTRGIEKFGDVLAARTGPESAQGKDVVHIDPEAVLKQLSSEEKIALLSGDDMWHTAPVKRLGVPRVRVSEVSSCSTRDLVADEIVQRWSSESGPP